jgi:predicted molibdopterin-dependent oxidoreductase YjgC
MACGQIGRMGVGVNPLRGQNNVQGSCDMGAFPHEYPGYRHVSDENVAKSFEDAWGVKLDREPGLRISNMFDAAIDGTFKGLYVQGEDIAQSDPNTKHVEAALSKMECVVVQDLFLIETTRYAHVFLPGSSFLEKDGTFTNAERQFVPTDEKTTAKFPLILTTGRILSQYNVGAQTRRTENNVWHTEDKLDIHPFDAEHRGIRDGDLVSIASRSGDISLHARVTEKMQPGVVYTTFHHAMSGANVVTTEYSDWATNCPEYKVTAVEVRLAKKMSNWQEHYHEHRDLTTRIDSGSPVAGD